ncbi:RHO1 GDP-GTP exchange protein 2 [Ceratobasidium sp. 414]|nr:RHO1 GDP-GTP exchange protein 2 [Ceratobasidium sp. 414]
MTFAQWVAPFSDKHDRAVYVTVVMKQQIPERPNVFPSFEGDEADRLWKVMVESWARNPSDRPGSTIIRDRLRSTKKLKGIKQRATPTPRGTVPRAVPKAINRNATHATKHGLADGVSLEYKPKVQLQAPVILKRVVEVDSASETDMARRGLTSVIDYDFNEPGQLWVHSVPQEVVDSVSETEKKRQEAINEIIYTERDFVRDLEYLRDSWMAPLKTDEVIPPGRRMNFVQQVFWNIEDIIDVNTRLRDLLSKRQKAYPIVETIGDIFLELVPHFTPLVQYGKRQLYGKYEFEKEKASNPTFAVFVEMVERLPASRKLELNEYLTKPITRLAWYSLLLEVVLDCTPEDNVDRVAITKVVKLVREFLGEINEESGKAENRFNLLQLDTELVFRQGEEVDLKLKDEQRQLVCKGPLKRWGGAANENGDLQIFLFDHALLMAESRVVDEHEQLKVFRRPIPLGLLVVSTPEERTTTASGTPLRAAPTQLDSQKGQYPLMVSHLGKRGYSLVLCAPTVVARRKWVEHITTQQEVIRERSMVFDTFMLSKGVFVGEAKVNCAALYNMGRHIAYGTDVGVYFQVVGEGKNRTPVKVLNLAGVQQIDVLGECQLLIVLSERSALTFPLDAVESPYPASSIKRMKWVSSHASFFKVGQCLGRTLVCVVKASPLSSTVKAFELIGWNLPGKSKLTFRELLQKKVTLEVFKVRTVRSYVIRITNPEQDFCIPMESHSIHFLKTKLCVACTKGFMIVDLETLDTQAMLDPADASLDFVQRRGDVRPLGMYRIDGEFLLCYSEFAFYVNKSGWKSKRDMTIYWEGTPTAFALHYPYLMAFDPTFVEIRQVEDGALVQVIRGNNLRCLFADTQLFVTNPPMMGASSAASSSGHPIYQNHHPYGGQSPYSRYAQAVYHYLPASMTQAQPHDFRRSRERDEIILVSDDKVMVVQLAVPPARTPDTSAPRA